MPRSPITNNLRAEFHGVKESGTKDIFGSRLITYERFPGQPFSPSSDSSKNPRKPLPLLAPAPAAASCGVGPAVVTFVPPLTCLALAGVAAVAP